MQMKIKQPLHLKTEKTWRNYEPEPPKIFNVEAQKSINVETKIFESVIEAKEYSINFEANTCMNIMDQTPMRPRSNKILYQQKNMIEPFKMRNNKPIAH